jgi:hypothetical protein
MNTPSLIFEIGSNGGNRVIVGIRESTMLVLSRLVGDKIFVNHGDHWIRIELKAAANGTGFVTVKYDTKYFNSNVVRNPVELSQRKRIWFEAPNGEMLEVNFTWPKSHRSPRLGFEGPRSFEVNRGELL